MKCIFKIHKANTLTITYANILSLDMNQIKNLICGKIKKLTQSLKRFRI